MKDNWPVLVVGIGLFAWGICEWRLFTQALKRWEKTDRGGEQG